MDVPYQYLTFFMEDDEELKRIGKKELALYSSMYCEVRGRTSRIP